MCVSHTVQSDLMRSMAVKEAEIQQLQRELNEATVQSLGASGGGDDRIELQRVQKDVQELRIALAKERMDKDELFSKTSSAEVAV